MPKRSLFKILTGQEQDIVKNISLPELKEHLQSLIDIYTPRLNGGEIKLSFHDIHETHPKFNINGNKPGWAASTIKIPVLISTFQQIDENNLSLNNELIIDHRYPLELYDPITNMESGTPLSIGVLLYYMIRNSDNEATNMLADKIGLEKINQTMSQLGASKTMMAHLLTKNVLRLITEWNPAGSNLTSANDLCTLLTSIYTNQAASSKSCKHMQAYLEHGDRGPIGSSLPARTIIGSKMGYITHNLDGDDLIDAAVINRDYVLTIMCNRINNPSLSKRAAENKPHSIRPQIIEPLYQEYEDFERIYAKMNSTPSASEAIRHLSRMVYDFYYCQQK